VKDGNLIYLVNTGRDFFNRGKPLVKMCCLKLTRWNKFRSSTENNNYQIISRKINRRFVVSSEISYYAFTWIGDNCSFYIRLQLPEIWVVSM